MVRGRVISYNRLKKLRKFCPVRDCRGVPHPVVTLLRAPIAVPRRGRFFAQMCILVFRNENKESRREAENGFLSGCGIAAKNLLVRGRFAPRLYAYR
jgi:hypothetical protein